MYIYSHICALYIYTYTHIFIHIRAHTHTHVRCDFNSILVADYLTKIGINTVPHPLYSPDLVHCDFCLFPKLRGCR